MENLLKDCYSILPTMPKENHSGSMADQFEVVKKVEDIDVNPDDELNRSPSPECSSSSSISIIDEEEIIDLCATCADKNGMTEYANSQLGPLMANMSPSEGTEYFKSQLVYNKRRNESSKKFISVPDSSLSSEIMQRKQSTLQQAINADTNIERQDDVLYKGDFQSTSESIQLDKDANINIFQILTIIVKRFLSLIKPMTLPFPNESTIFQGESCCEDCKTGLLLLFFGVVALNMLSVIGPPNSEVENWNSTISALQKENIYLKKQIIHNKKKENRKLASLTWLISQKIEENENASRNCIKSSELETFYQAEVNQLKKEVASLEDNYKTVQNHLKKVNSVIEETEKEKSPFEYLLEYITNENIFDKNKSDDQNTSHQNKGYLEKIILFFRQKLSLTEIKTKVDNFLVKAKNIIDLDALFIKESVLAIGISWVCCIGILFVKYWVNLEIV